MSETKRTARLFGVCYALALIFWVVFCLGRCAVMLAHRAGGNMPQTTLTAADLTFESFVCYLDLEWDTPPDDDPNWYLSTDNDPHILYDGGGYIETVRLYAVHRLPPGSVALYYLLPGQTDYSEAQKVYARVTGAGEYTFDLGGRRVSGLRIDPDSVGGVPTLFHGIELNPAVPWYDRFVPDGGQWLLLLFGPALAAAAAGLVQSIVRGDGDERDTDV